MTPTMKSTTRQLAASVAIAAALVCAAPRKAEADSVEVVADNNHLSLDLKVGSEVAPRTTIFGRTITSVDYHQNTGIFQLIDLTYNLSGGANAVLEHQFIPGVGVIPRLGVEYFTQQGNLGLYGLGTARLNRDTNAEFAASVEYTPHLTDALRLYALVEAVSNVGGEGHNYSLERLRLGVQEGKYTGGLAANLGQTGPEGEFSYGLGGFFKIKLE